jgi:hypothetical protein
MGDISDLLEKVTKKVSVTDFWTKVISLVLTLVFLTYSKAIATYFGKDLQAFEIESEKNQTNQ